MNRFGAKDWRAGRKLGAKTQFIIATVIRGSSSSIRRSSKVYTRSAIPAPNIFRSNHNLRPLNRHLPRIHLPHARIRLLPVGVENKPHRVPGHVQTPRTLQHPTAISAPQQWLLALRIRAADRTRGGIAHIIEIGIVAIAAEEEQIYAIGGTSQARRFDQGPIGVVPVEEGDRVAHGRCAVAGADLLEFDGRRVRTVGVTARAAAAEGVAVDFVGDVKEAGGGVDEGCRVDGTTVSAHNVGREAGGGTQENDLLQRASEWFIAGGHVRPIDAGGRGRADAVFRGVFLGSSRVVKDEGAIGLDTGQRSSQHGL